jgi:CTD small phosphatase-like protein 2
MSEKFTIILFTASNQEYADKIIDKLDPKRNLVSYRLYRKDCLEHEELYVKDLRIFKNVAKEDMIIVDNIICSYALDLQCGIPIKPYCSGKEDYELEYICNQLSGLRAFMNGLEYL